MIEVVVIFLHVENGLSYVGSQILVFYLFQDFPPGTFYTQVILYVFLEENVFLPFFLVTSCEIGCPLIF